MTDMRATARVLETLARDAREIADETLRARILADIRELQRRGDTLVRRDDLLVVVEADEFIAGSPDGIRYKAAIDRLENALGGKLT